MTQSIYLRNSLSVAAIAVLRAVLPAGIVAGALFVLAILYDVGLQDHLVTLGALSAAMSVAMMRPASEDYASERNGSWQGHLLLRWAGLLAVLLAVGYVTGLSNQYPRPLLLTWAGVTPLLLLGGIGLLNGAMRRVVASPENIRSAVIAGVNPTSRVLAQKLSAHPELCIRVEGFFDDRGGERLGPIEELKLLGRLSETAAYVRERKIAVIFIALPMRHVQRVMALLEELHDSTASVYYVPDLFVFDLIQSRTAEIMGMPVVAMCESPFYGYRGVTKRITDVVLTLGILTVALPVMAIVALGIWLTSRGPVIFRQRRYGLDGQEFVVYKFRSMYITEDGEVITQATQGDARVTPIGRLLRRTSLDELPQLFNVLQGRMSLVGPRPHAVAHNEEYRRRIKGYMMRHKVLPGITGLAQVHGYRGETKTLEQMELRVRYDLDYLRHWTPLLDIKILAMTAVKMFRDRHAY